MAIGTLILSIVFGTTIIIGIALHLQRDSLRKLVYESVLYFCQFGALWFMLAINVLWQVVSLKNS